MANQVKPLGDKHREQVGEKRLRRAASAVELVMVHVDDKEFTEEDKTTAEILAYGALRVWDLMQQGPE